ncbi:SCO family protein [Natribaculum luteum]|uniref:SCO family protein n=1 Tax=Natribaculum luteum TaxID=1586232 RepID=A0ABD5P1S9_9EURY|nr:SCO family protein [Natribaculum luteum]
MDRRTYLRSLGATGAVAAAGCLESLPGTGGSQTVLGPPEKTRGDPVYPIHGEELPSFSLPDPIAGEEIASEQFEGERSLLVTFLYTSCPDGVCSALLLRLRRAQEAAAAGGYGDDVAFLTMTVDPERDTADVLRSYADERGADPEADNWHFLRPKSYEAARDLLEEKFGVVVEKVDPENVEGHENHGSLEYLFAHVSLILLVNERGIVERAYQNVTAPSGVEPSELVSDLETVVNG